MRCIFCKENSGDTKSLEHIIPESLGNKSHVLPRGTVCDKCNNYFSIKVEKKVLESPYFKNLRVRNGIKSKKGKFPNGNAVMIHELGGEVEFSIDNEGFAINIEDRPLLELVRSGKIKRLHIPMQSEPIKNDIFISRFLAKVALEALASRVSSLEHWNEDLVDHDELDDLRYYARYGRGRFWDYHQRKIYAETTLFEDLHDPEKPRYYQMVHEYDFLYIETKYLFFICCIFGVEYVINMREPNLELYHLWLSKNSDRSPLDRDHQIKYNNSR